MAAGTVALTEEKWGGLYKVKMAWTSDGAGAVNGTATAKIYSGVVVWASFVPGTVGDQPTDKYILSVLDQDGNDVLGGVCAVAGTGLSNAATVYKKQTDGLGWVKSDTLTLTITGAGITKKGTAYLYIMPTDAD